MTRVSFSVLLTGNNLLNLTLVTWEPQAHWKLSQVQRGLLEASSSKPTYANLLYTLWIWSYWLASRHLPYRWMVMDHLANKIFLPAIENLDHDLRFYPMYSLVNYPELLRVNHPNHWQQFYNLLWLRTGLGWFSICFQCQVPNGIYPMGRNQRLKYSFLQWKPGWELE